MCLSGKYLPKSVTYRKICLPLRNMNNKFVERNGEQSYYYSGRKGYRGYHCPGMYLSGRNKVNILDISQTIVQEYFTMMMIVDMTKLEKPFEEVVTELTNVGAEIGVQIKCQREEIFDKMHRI